MVLRTLTISQNLASGALDHSFDFSNFNRAFKLVSVYFHASVDITEDFSVSYDSNDGSTYDTLIDQINLQSESDYVYAAQGEVAFNINDKVRVQCTNANTIGVVYVTCKVETPE